MKKVNSGDAALCSVNKKDFFRQTNIAFLMLVITGIFVFASAFFAQGSPAALEVEAASGETVIEGATNALSYSDEGFTGTSIDDSFANENALDEAFLSNETTVAAEEAGIDILPTAELSIVPLTDAVPFLDPVPPGAVAVATAAQLNTAVTNANAGTGSNYIFFTAGITTAASPGGVNPTGGVINNAGLANGGEGLIIDGRGHLLTHGGESNSTFNLQGTGAQRTLTLKNLDINPAGGTAEGDNNAMIAFAPGPGADAHSAAQTAGSFYWTVNFHNVRNVGNFTRGIVSLSNGVVNFSGTNEFHLVQRRTLINARMVNFDGGETTLSIVRTGTGAAGTTNAVGRRMNVIRANPSNDIARAQGVGVTLNNGAEVNITRDVRDGGTSIAAGTGREGNAILIDSGGLTTANVRPAVLELSEGSSLTVVGNPRGTGSTVANNGVVSIRGGSGGVDISEGSELHVHNARRGTGTNAGTSALIQEIRGGIFILDGQGSSAHFIQESAQHRRQATLRFYMASGVSNQTVTVTDGAELNIHRIRSGTDAEIAALRFGQGTGNGFHVENGTVNIVNEGGGRAVAVNPGTSNANGFNAGVEFAANTWFFRVNADSDMQVVSERGAAINARGHRNGEISVTQGANFTAMGRTAGTGTAAATIRATGGNVHFNMHHPQFYDFVNTRPGGGRVFALGTRAGNTFTSTHSDVSVWRRGVNVWDGEPDRHWTLIDVHLRGAQLRIADTGRTYADFVRYYNTSPHSRRMENYTRIMGNNSQPIINEALDLTNADRHVRALAETPQGRIREPRPVWTNELWGNFTHVCGQTGTTQAITSNDTPLGELVHSLHTETLYEREVNVKTVDGVLRMTHEDGRYLRAGDMYRIDAAWRASTPDLPRNHQASNIPPAFNFEVVRDVVPPMPVTVNDSVVPQNQVDFHGTWALEDEFDDGPRIGTDGIRLYARSGNAAPRLLAGSGLVAADNIWTFTADPGQLEVGDFVWITLADTQDPPNWNPIQQTPVRDRLIPEATWFIVAPAGTLPITVQHFFDDVEHVPYRYVSTSLTFPVSGELRTANVGPGVSTDEHVYFPPQSRQGYKVDRIELRGPLGVLVENVELGPDGRPLAPFDVSPGNTTIRVFYVIDPEYRRDVLFEFRFADFGGTGAGSLTLQASVPYPQVRTGSYNASGVNRFPVQGQGDFHILNTLTEAQLRNLINSLFDETDDGLGGTIPPVLGELPRGFVPCPENYIQLPLSGTGPGGTQLEFPVRMADLYNTQVSTVDDQRRPVVVNFVATLETIELSQEVERYTNLAGSTAELALFDSMSFNYELALSRGPVGGRTAAADGDATPWVNHQLGVSIESERAEPGESDDNPPAWAYYNAFTRHGTGAPLGTIRVGTWNNATAGLQNSGTGTSVLAGSGAAPAERGNKRIAIGDELVVENVPSTAYIAVTQQVNAGPVGTSTAPTAGNSNWLNQAIHLHHERDFRDSETSQFYLWEGSATHTANSANVSHITNWANPLPTDSNPLYNPGRPMDNGGREFHFRLYPVNSFMLTVTNQVAGSGADMDRARYFTVQLRDDEDTYVAAGRQFMLYTGEYVQGPVVGGSYNMIPVLTPVTAGANGLISVGLPGLLPGESFTLRGIGGMYQARVVMQEFSGHGEYTVRNQYERFHESEPSEWIPGMVAGPAAFNRDFLEVTFESYQSEFTLLPTGVVIAGSGALVTGLAGLGAVAVVAATRRRAGIEKLASKDLTP